MYQAKQLYDLQEVDLDLQRKSELLQQVEAQLSSNDVLAQAKAELQGERESLAALQREQRLLEGEVEDLDVKNKAFKNKLFGGSTKNSKELLGIQKESEHLEAKISAKEDKVLEMMAGAEELQKDIARREEGVRQLENEWKEEENRLLAEKAELETLLAEYGKRRDMLCDAIGAAELDLYEVLKSKKRGQAVAKVEQGRCQGCRINLPTSKLQQVRMQVQLAQCDHCERILYAE